MKKINLLMAVLIAILFTQCKTENQVESQEQVKNVILMIGDGMGVSQVYAGITSNESLNMERAEAIGFSKTFSANDYVTDSAAGGTAIACGQKTNNGYVGMDANKQPINSILHYASENGLATGIVVSCNLTHATPASFIAHQPDRNMGEEIAADYLLTPFDVAIGGGVKHFEKRSDERVLTDELKEKGYQIAYSLDEVKKIESGKMIGLLAEDHPDKYPARGELLPEGVSAALKILSQNDKGFFLMVEGSQIDWGGHANDTEMIINEVIDFDRAVKAAFDFADNNPGTLVVITADHETGGLSLIGKDKETGEINAKYSTGGHSGVMVPVFAYGTRASEFSGVYQNSDILGKVLRLYGIDKK